MLIAASQRRDNLPKDGENPHLYVEGVKFEAPGAGQPRGWGYRRLLARARHNQRQAPGARRLIRYQLASGQEA
jgi:hypothetical protein